MKLLIATVLFPVLLAAPSLSVAGDLDLAGKLVGKMMYAEAFDDAQVACLEQADGYDVESEVELTPALFGGIQPGDALWTEAKTLYIDMLRAGCFYDKSAAVDALTNTIAANLTDDDLRRLLEFYDTPLAERFVAATVLANDAAGRATERLYDSIETYQRFSLGLDKLLSHKELQD